MASWTPEGAELLFLARIQRHGSGFGPLLHGLKVLEDVPEVLEDVPDVIGEVEVIRGHLLAVKDVGEGAQESDCSGFHFPLAMTF